MASGLENQKTSNYGFRERTTAITQSNLYLNSTATVVNIRYFKTNYILTKCKVKNSPFVKHRVIAAFSRPELHPMMLFCVLRPLPTVVPATTEMIWKSSAPSFVIVALSTQTGSHCKQNILFWHFFIK